jgi:FixJ family two-component response regulator
LVAVLHRSRRKQPTVIIVDDDPGIREALGSPIRSVGVQAKALTSVPEFLNEGRPDGPTCLRSDPPELSGNAP